MRFEDCDFMTNFLTALWLFVGLIVGLAVGAVLGRRSHPVERSAKRGHREYSYRGPGGEGRSYGGTD
jgi:hypothetical protein